MRTKTRPRGETKERIAAHVRQYPGATAPEIAEAIGVGPARVYTVLKELRESPVAFNRLPPIARENGHAKPAPAESNEEIPQALADVNKAQQFVFAVGGMERAVAALNNLAGIVGASTPRLSRMDG